VQSLEALQRLPENVTCYSPRFSHMNEQLKVFLYEQLYRHYRVVRMSAKAQHYLRDLFETYVKDPALLPFEFQGWIERKGVHRTVADYIAGMTDRYALQEWQRLFDPFTRP
jgi:dGTPase